MTARADMERIIREAYDARVRCDVDGVCSLFGQDVRFQLNGSPELSPAAATAHGIDQFRTLLGQMIQTFEMKDHKIIDLIIDGSRAAVHWRATIRSSITGETATTDVVDLIEVTDGRFSSFVEFTDTALAGRMMQA